MRSHERERKKKENDKSVLATTSTHIVRRQRWANRVTSARLVSRGLNGRQEGQGERGAMEAGGEGQGQGKVSVAGEINKASWWCIEQHHILRQYTHSVMIQPPFFIFHPLPKSSPLHHPHQSPSQHVHNKHQFDTSPLPCYNPTTKFSLLPSSGPPSTQPAAPLPQPISTAPAPAPPAQSTSSS